MVVVMHGMVTMEPLIAQGCRALSEESVWLVQGCSGNIISAVSSSYDWHGLSLTAGRADSHAAWDRSHSRPASRCSH